MNGSTKWILFAAALAVSASGFVQGAPSIKGWIDLFTVQNVFGLAGVFGGVTMAFFTKPPASDPTIKITNTTATPALTE